ncbi:MAG: DUF1205 domain-containing protein [Pseudonocardiaceae bacterium]|nr:DUF1205 domain-containing protein [Pseudonocardiaceae bacterium]
MKALFITGGSMATVFPQASLARAARDAGHEILMAAPDSVTPVIAKAGLPPVSISARKKQQFPQDIPDDPAAQMRLVGRWYADVAVESVDLLLDLATDWRPDIVAGGGMFHTASLLAHRLAVPSVRQPWGMLDSGEYDAGATERLRPLLGELGLDRLPEPDLPIDVRPPSLESPDEPPAQKMRWIPGNLQRPLERWMYTRGERRRVFLTSGSRVTSEGTLHTMTVDFLRDVAQAIAALGTEVLVAVPDDVASELLTGLDGEQIRAGWLPMDIVAPTCDLIVHHAGTGTSMTAMAAGVPELMLREPPSLGEMQPLIEFGNAIELPKGEHTLDNIVSACDEMLSNPTYRERARILAREIADLPLPSEVVGVMEKLVAG